jgi:senataxin
LIPLQYGCKRLILIGDPNQLPATVFSKTTEKLKYSLSLFQRLQMNNIRVHLLRM